jgi:chemotaxis regulatin CheY-phosphate phosphatase CheZ
MNKRLTNNPNGRPKGTPNKITGELRANIQTFLDANFETIIQAFETLDARDKLNYFVKLLEYAIPKQRQIEDTTLAQLFAMTPEQRAERIKEIEKTLNIKK